MDLQILQLVRRIVSSVPTYAESVEKARQSQSPGRMECILGSVFGRYGAKAV